MDIDLRNWTDEQQKALLNFTETLAAETDDGLANFGNPDDLDGAEKQAKEFIEAKRAGRSGKSEIASDKTIRKGVREWLRRTNRIPRDSA